MKTIVNSISFFLFFVTIILNAQSTELISEIKLIVTPQQDKIILRWAVDDALTWKKANQYGYFLERSLISRNGEPILPLQKTILNNGQPFIPAPLAEWEEPFKTDDNAAVIAQALYGESFQTGTLDPIASIMAVNEELQQRFVFALVAAEQSFSAAKLAGWGYEDLDVNPGEKYLYKIWIATPSGETLAKEAKVFSSIDFYEPLPVPRKPIAFFKEHKADINWDFGILKNVYTSYDVERSGDGNNFVKINNYPIFNAEREKPNKPISLSYTDSIPNDKTYHYRIKGRTSFGQVGPPSKSVSGQAKETLKFVPQITKKLITEDDTAVLHWQFDTAANQLIKGFELQRSNTDYDGFSTVIADIAPTTRKITYDKLKSINYFKIVAIGKNGDKRPSHAAIVQPVDSIPPKPPVGLLGVVDTTGVVKLNWTANTEKDLGGYRVFRSNNSKTEFFEVTKSPIKKINFSDTIQTKNLNKKIYYKILAQDQRYNASKFSNVLTLDKPDVLPPSPPVITKYNLEDQKLYLEWIPSSSTDVIMHIVYRSTNGNEQWQKIAEIENESTNYKDENIQSNASYRYVVVAKDTSGLESTPTSPLEIDVTERLFQDLILKLNGSVNREARSILLSWKINQPNIKEIYLYKSLEETNTLSLYKVLPGLDKNFEDQSLKVNTTYEYAIKAILTNGVESQLKKITINY